MQLERRNRIEIDSFAWSLGVSPGRGYRETLPRSPKEVLIQRVLSDSREIQQTCSYHSTMASLQNLTRDPSRHAKEHLSR